MSDPIDLSTLSADDITRIASYFPLGIIAAIADDQAALVTGGATTADLTKLHDLTATAAEVNQLHSQGAITTDFAKLHAITAAAATLNQVAAAAGTVTFARSEKIARVALGALDTGGGVFAWANPEAGSIIINQVTLDVTTKSTSGCTVDVGVTAASATTSNDTLLDGLDVGTSAGVFTSDVNHGSDGAFVAKLATGKWVTASMATGAAAGLVGFAYIRYFNI